MPTLSYKLQGRFGNNLIQYCIAKLLCKLFGHTLISRKERNALSVTDVEWPELASFLVKHQHEPAKLRRHPYAKVSLTLDGYFQRSEVLVAFRPFFQSLFTTSNPDALTPTLKIAEIAGALQRVDSRDEIIVHLRLDDFQRAGAKGSSVILHPSWYQKVLDSIRSTSSRPIRIVYDRKGVQEEEAYLSAFQRYTPILQSSDVLTDFATLANAKTLVSSNSTFSWMAAFLSSCPQTRYLPTICHMGSQNLGTIDLTDTVSESVFLPN